MQNQLYIDFKHALFVGTLADVQHHEHTTGAICVSLESPMALVNGSDEFHTKSAFVPQHVAVKIQSESPLLIYSFELNSNFSKAVGAHLSTNLGKVTPDLQFENMLCDIGKNVLDLSEITNESLNQLLTEVGVTDEASTHIDARIQRVINHLENNLNENVSVEEMTKWAGLSKSRLNELFKQSTGLSIRRYRLWQRLKAVALNIQKGQDLTSAAYNAGFSDSAHLSNSCKKLLGISPTQLLANRDTLNITVG